jgi:hypothetical protein
MTNKSFSLFLALLMTGTVIFAQTVISRKEFAATVSEIRWMVDIQQKSHALNQEVDMAIADIHSRLVGMGKIKEEDKIGFDTSRNVVYVVEKEK